MDFSDSAGMEAIADAERGDLRALVARLRDPDARLTMEEREFAAARLAGEVKLPRGRPRDKNAALQRELRTWFALRERISAGNQRDHAIDLAAADLGMSRTTVMNHLRAIDENPGKKRDCEQMERAIRQFERAIEAINMAPDDPEK